jgi:IclR family acetate operon transcriptional repressor
VAGSSETHGPMARWLAILEAFLDRDEWGVRELAAFAGLSPSVTHRILHEMARHGLLVAAQVRGQFRVGPELNRIAVLLADRLDVTRIGGPILKATAEDIGETVVLALYSATRRKFWAVDAAESPHTIRYIWESLREWSDVHLGSSGKGILAFLPEDERETILTDLPDPIPGLRPISKAALRDELDLARHQGFVISRGERYAGAIGVSAPIRNATGRVIGDLVAAWPDNRTDREKEQRVADAIVSAADHLSEALGFRAAARYDTWVRLAPQVRDTSQIV